MIVGHTVTSEVSRRWLPPRGRRRSACSAGALPRPCCSWRRSRSAAPRAAGCSRTCARGCTPDCTPQSSHRARVAPGARNRAQRPRRHVLRLLEHRAEHLGHVLLDQGAVRGVHALEHDLEQVVHQAIRAGALRSRIGTRRPMAATFCSSACAGWNADAAGSSKHRIASMNARYTDLSVSSFSYGSSGAKMRRTSLRHNATYRRTSCGKRATRGGRRRGVKRDWGKTPRHGSSAGDRIGGGDRAGARREARRRTLSLWLMSCFRTSVSGQVFISPPSSPWPTLLSASETSWRKVGEFQISGVSRG